MSDTDALFAALRQSADPAAAAAIQALVEEGEDRALNRVNVYDFARRTGLDEDTVIGAFLHAARLGLFEMSWNVLCPGCGGVLDANATLKTVHQENYSCALCAAGYEPTLDEMVEVTFTVSPQVRRIAAHDPDRLPAWDYMSQMFWSSGVDLPADLVAVIEGTTLAAVELAPLEKTTIELDLPAEFIIVFEPVTHAAQFFDVKGEPRAEAVAEEMVFNDLKTPTGTKPMRPGRLQLTLENATHRRVLPAVWRAGNELHDLLMRRKPFLTATRLLTNQTFRDIYRTDTLDIDQRLKVTSLTFLFTDLKGSTALYERVGDLAAYDLVKAHFRVLHDIVAAERGAVVKTIGDAVMATFPSPERAMAAALKMRAAMHGVGARQHEADLVLKIGIHEGPCLAVMLNERQDYFGQTVNIAARVQNLATSPAIMASGAVVEDGRTAELLDAAKLAPVAREAALRGVDETVRVYEIP